MAEFFHLGFTVSVKPNSIIKFPEESMPLNLPLPLDVSITILSPEALLSIAPL